MVAFAYRANVLALDFLNTCFGVGSGRTERLTSDGDVIDWLLGTGRVSKEDVSRVAPWRPGTLRRRAIAHRERLRTMCAAFSEGRAVARADVSALNALLARERFHKTLSFRGAAPKIAEARHIVRVDDLVATIAGLTLEIFAQDPRRVKRCANHAGCSLFFYDVSRNGGRVWCSMSGCGNRAKVYAYREREAAVG